MQTIGQLLKQLRQEQKLTLNEISQETNIAVHLLEALENDDFKLLPSSTFTKGFITSYAQVLGLSSQKALAVFRRDFTISQTGKIMPKGLEKPLNKTTLVTSKLLFFVSLGGFLIAFLFYIFIQFKNYGAPPTLEIIRPRVKAIVKGPTITVNGYVSAESTVYINGQLAEVFPTGEFRSTVQLPTGEQNIEIRAINHKNKATTQNISVTVVDK